MESLGGLQGAWGVPLVDIPGFIHLLRDWGVEPGKGDQLREAARRAAQVAPHYLCATCAGPHRRPAGCAAPCPFGEAGPASPVPPPAVPHKR